MLTVALAKGRTAEDLVPLWRESLLPCPEDVLSSRALVFEVDWPPGERIRFLLAKPMDVPTYVFYGVADLGVVGKDILLEQERAVYELLNLEVARCRLCVAGRPELATETPQRVATKYPRLAESYFRRQGQVVDLVELGGSIELAAVIGLTDRIFDLVQTGATLAANGLTVFDEVEQISARLIVNRSSYRLKSTEIATVVEGLTAAVRRRRVHA